MKKVRAITVRKFENIINLLDYFGRFCSGSTHFNDRDHDIFRLLSQPCRADIVVILMALYGLLIVFRGK